MSRKLAVFAGVTLGLAPTAGATQIDFEDFPQLTPINTQYAGQGVALFSCPSNDPNIMGAFQVDPPVTGQSLIGFPATGGVEVIRADFVSPVSDVSIDAGDNSDDLDDAFLEAYDEDDVLLDADTFFLNGRGAFSLAVSSGTPIAYVVFGSVSTINGSSLVWDNLDFTLAPECFLILGDSPSPGSFGGAGHTWSTQVSGLASSYAVLLDDLPTFPLPVPPAPGKARKLPHPIGSFNAQILMWNPSVFPNNPEQFSHGLEVTLWSDGRASAERYGSRDGITIRMEVFEENGQRLLRFPFSIQGFP